MPKLMEMTDEVLNEIEREHSKSVLAPVSGTVYGGGWMDMLAQPIEVVEICLNSDGPFNDCTALRLVREIRRLRQELAARAP